jgi:hypothetical protein
MSFAQRLHAMAGGILADRQFEPVMIRFADVATGLIERIESSGDV